MKDMFFIVSIGCLSCAKMRIFIRKALKDLKLENEINVVEIDSESEEAIDIAVKNEILDIPGCSFNGKSVYGESFLYDDIYELIKEQSE